MNENETPTAYVGLWYGGPGYSEGSWATDAEWFENLEHAEQVLSHRHRCTSHLATPTHAVEWSQELGDYQRPVKGNQLDTLATPAVEGSNLLLVPVDQCGLEQLESEGPYACSLLLTLDENDDILTQEL